MGFASVVQLRSCRLGLRVCAVQGLGFVQESSGHLDQRIKECAEAAAMHTVKSRQDGTFSEEALFYRSLNREYNKSGSNPYGPRFAVWGFRAYQA